MEKRPIVIMAAMESEANFLLEKLKNVNWETINQYKFYEGTINSYPVVVCRCNVMSINASIASCIAIQKYHPITIISQGTAGGHGKDIHSGDIIIGQKCVNIMSSKTPAKKDGEGSNSLDWELINFISGEEDRLIYQLSNEHLVELCKTITYTEGIVHFGILGSGDVWNKETDRILHLNQKYGTLCEDMESIAIYTVANNFNIPVIGIRIISNNESLGEPFDSNTALECQKFVYEFVLKLIEENKYFLKNRYFL